MKRIGTIHPDGSNICITTQSIRPSPIQLPAEVDISSLSVMVDDEFISMISPVSQDTPIPDGSGKLVSGILLYLPDGHVEISMITGDITWRASHKAILSDGGIELVTMANINSSLSSNILFDELSLSTGGIKMMSAKYRAPTANMQIRVKESAIYEPPEQDTDEEITFKLEDVTVYKEQSLVIQSISTTFETVYIANLTAVSTGPRNPTVYGYRFTTPNDLPSGTVSVYSPGDISSIQHTVGTSKIIDTSAESEIEMMMGPSRRVLFEVTSALEDTDKNTTTIRLDGTIINKFTSKMATVILVLPISDIEVLDDEYEIRNGAYRWTYTVDTDSRMTFSIAYKKKNIIM